MKVKVNVYADEWGLATFRKAPKQGGHVPMPIDACCVYVGDVEVEPVGVIWGTPEDVENEIRERVEAAAKEKGLIS